LGSCTTNALAPLITVIDKEFEIISALCTTIHAYTNDQNLLDGAHKDLRRARAAALNIIPTKTGADKVITQLFPHLEGKISAIALRVPTPIVSLIDLSVVTKKPVDKEIVNAAFLTASKKQFASILAYSKAPLVSSDFQKHPASAIFDADLTMAIKNQVKVFAWYDNEFGYCARIIDFLLCNL